MTGPGSAVRLDRRELAGAVADLGVLLPIAVALIVTAGLSPTAVLLPPALLYLAVAAIYRVPVPVQPLKAFAAVALAEGFGAPEIAAGALLMAALFLPLGASGLLDRVAAAFPKPLIRGVQLTVGLLFLKIAWGLASDPPGEFEASGLDATLAVALAAGALVVLLALRRTPVALALVAAGLAVALARSAGELSLGPSDLAFPDLDLAALGTALTLLVLPQAPLSFANSCLATQDAARTYWGERARRVRAGRLAMTLGAGSAIAGAIGGMPVCHGAGGATAHSAFGARTAGAPLFMGGVLLVLALGLGAGLAGVLAAFPLPVLAALLAAAGILHIGLLRDLEGRGAWALALAVGALGYALNLAIALGAGLLAWWAGRAVARIGRAEGRAVRATP